MAERGGSKARLIFAGAALAGVAAGIVAKRAYVARDRRRPDPDAGEDFGELHGDMLGPVVSDDGTRLHVEQWGSGPGIVLAHGYALDLTLWHYQIADLGRDHRVIAFDQRGHGSSGRPPDGAWGLDALARDLDAVIHAQGSAPVVVIGHSMGGMALLEYCKLFPESIGSHVAGIVLVDTTAADVMGGMIPGIGRYVQATIQGFQEAAMRALASNVTRLDRIRGHVSDVAYLGTRFLGFGPRPSPSKVAYLDRVLASAPSDVVLALLPTLTGMDVTEVLDAIDVPALVVAGSHDRLTPPGAARRLVEGIKGAELLVVGNAGHMSMFERPDEFNAGLRRFLHRIPGWR